MKYTCTIRTELLTENTIIQNDGFGSIEFINYTNAEVYVNNLLLPQYTSGFAQMRFINEPYVTITNDFKVISGAPNISVGVIKYYYSEI
ncbi:MAG: hypothetical protein LBN95_13710 [Prevotellaceae bacterium]|jgi:hypothetical protein|nr:hypothetical protein [Prevotellaceae bacterium]